MGGCSHRRGLQAACTARGRGRMEAADAAAVLFPAPVLLQLAAKPQSRKAAQQLSKLKLADRAQEGPRRPPERVHKRSWSGLGGPLGALGEARRPRGPLGRAWGALGKP